MTEREFGLAAIDDILSSMVTGREQSNIRWESFTSQFIHRIKTAKVYVDCGAEYGFYISLALKYGPPDIQIIAFEPERIRFELLQNWMKSYPNVKIYPLAVSDSSVKREAIKPDVGVSLSFEGCYHSVGFRFTVDTTTLDEILQDTKVDILKMDIEGAEDLAFKGMTKALKNKPKLFIEWHPPTHELMRIQTVELLYKSGYEIFLEGSQQGRVVLE